MGIVKSLPLAHPRLHFHSHIKEGSYISAAAVDFGGGTMRWWRDSTEAGNYIEIDKAAASAPPGNDGLIFLPYMVGQRTPFFNNNMKGVVFGLQPSHTMAHFSRMFMEGAAYAMRYVLDVFRESGMKPRSAILTGGVANSPVWRQIVSDVMEIPIDIPDVKDAAYIGAAAAAGVACGMFRDLEDALGEKIKRKHYSPNAELFETYRKTYNVFLKALEANMPVYDYAAGKQ
jgi:xylulokinase